MAKFFEWDAKQYSLDVELMDEQHQVLIDLMNQLAERSAAGAGRAELLDVLKKLGNYTVKHFREEEAYMKSIAYPKMASHVRIHRELVEKLHEYVDEFVKGDGHVSTQLLAFLKMWLGAHIKGIDMQYANYSHARKSA